MADHQHISRRLFLRNTAAVGAVASTTALPAVAEAVQPPTVEVSALHHWTGLLAALRELAVEGARSVVAVLIAEVALLAEAGLDDAVATGGDPAHPAERRRGPCPSRSPRNSPARRPRSAHAPAPGFHWSGTANHW